MDLLKISLFFYLYFWPFVTGFYSRSSNGCRRGFNCIFLDQCPQLNKYLGFGPQRNIKKVRNSICGFRNRQTLVCCPSQRYVEPVIRSWDTPLKLSPNKYIGSELLPKNCGEPMIHNKIFGGTPTPIGAYPWLAALGYRVPNMDRYLFDCSGSIINERYILTAAHCVHPRHTGRRRLSVIQLGTWNLSTEEDCNEDIRNLRARRCYPHLVLGFEDVIIHSEYDQDTSAHDVALIRLNRTLNFERPDNVLIAPICLPPNTMKLSDLSGKTAIAAGWGFTEFGNRSTILMSVQLPIVDNQRCLQLFKFEFVRNQLCAGGKRGEDTCIGDSGGPLFLSNNFGPLFTQIGIVSFGQSPCGAKSSPSVYTFVANYREWIEENIKP